MTLTITKHDTLEKARWDGLVATSDDTSLYHTWDWIEGTRQVFGFATHYFVAEENGQWVGGWPVQTTRQKHKGSEYYTGHSIRMGECGPFVDKTVSPKSRKAILETLNAAVQAWAKEETLVRLECNLPTLAPNNRGALHGINPMDWLGWEDGSTHTLIKDLSASEEDLLASLSYDARRSIKLCREAGYTVERGYWPDHLAQYYQIHTETYQRTGVKPHPLAYFEMISGKIANNCNALLWVGKDKAGQPVAFHNDARYGTGSLYWTGCCENDHLKSGINYLLFWEAMLGAKADGCRWYEVGEVFPGTSDPKKQGLSTFKGKFASAENGEVYRFFRARQEITPLPQPSLLGKVKREFGRSVKKALTPPTSPMPSC